MSHLFSPVHRKAKKKDSTHEHYHGSYCEQQYILGMRLAEQLKELRLLIKFKRNSTETLRKHIGFYPDKELFWREVRSAKNDPRTLQQVREQLADVEEKLRVVKLNYQIGFMVSRRMDRNNIKNAILWSGYLDNKDAQDLEHRTDVIIGLVTSHEPKGEIETRILKGREVSLPSEKEMGRHLHFHATDTIRMNAKGEK